MGSKTSVVAPSNIALVKYWGKRNPELNLPYVSSLSMTLAGLHAHTTVEFGVEEDEFWLDGERAEGEVYERFKSHLDLIREEAGTDSKARIVSENNFPTAAGLASSAAGFAAMTLACSEALGTDWDTKKLTQMAKVASGSAARSFHGGFVRWNRGEGEDGSDCYAEQLAPTGHWPELRVLATIVSDSRKHISSTRGMDRTVRTCPYYEGWIRSSEEDLEAIREALLDRDFTSLGERAEFNALRLHHIMETSRPPIVYSTPETHSVRDTVRELRDEGTECYFTQDAGANVKILCLERDVEEIERRIQEEHGLEVIEAPCGDGAETTDEHLF